MSLSSVLRRLMASSLETGSLTAVLAIVVEILFQKLKQTNRQFICLSSLVRETDFVLFLQSKLALFGYSAEHTVLP
jgi:hypothetical protein